MAANDQLDNSISAWLQDAAPSQLPQRVLTATFGQTRRMGQARIPRWKASVVPRSRAAFASATAAAIVIVAAGSLGLGLLLSRQAPGATPSPHPSSGIPAFVELGIFEPVAGWVVYGGASGIWGDNPGGPDVKLAGGAGEPLEWSRDGTRLLVEGEHLFILHADGSETQLTPDSLPIRAATISPDGSRVVFGALIDGEPGLYAVDADGGPAELLIQLENPEGVSYSPDGVHIAYLTGSGDNSHRVWIMEADGNNSHVIVANDTTLGAGHVQGIAWSPAGDRIALGLEGTIFTFAPDGTDFSAGLSSAGQSHPFWSPDGAQLETKGPWHPGRSLPSTESPPAPQPTAPPLDTAAQEFLDGFVAARVAGVGAEQYLEGPDDVVFGDVPLLYATTEGNHYERAGFKQVLGLEWPYELTAFRVRLLAGRDVVEQLLFLSRENQRLVLEYVPDGFATELAPTTENGIPIARPYVAFDGAVTLDVAHPWVFHYDGGPISRPRTAIGEQSHPFWEP